MDQANSWTFGFDSIECLALEPLPFGLYAYAELGNNIFEADLDEAVTDRSLPSSFGSFTSSLDATSPADSVITDGCIFDEPVDYHHDISRPTPEAEQNTFSLGFRSRLPGSPVSFSPEQPLEQLLRCNFSGCASAPFRKMCDFKSHLKYHAVQVLDNWTGSQPCRCSWPKCPSKALFKSPRMLQTHLENIHVSPLLCSFPNCTHRTPFRSNFDLKRHLRIHSGEQGHFHCPYPNCEKDPKIFVRKDKWLNHLRSSHSGDTCPLNHCSAAGKGEFQSQAEIVEHIKKYHGNFECGIGSCSSGSRSRFTESDLLTHLEMAHGLQYDEIGSARNAAKLASDWTVRSKDIRDYHDCTCCRQIVKVLTGMTHKEVAEGNSIR